MTGFESGFFVPDVPLAVAFLAGLFSFASPCVFPLIPSYLSYVSGFSVAELSGGPGNAEDAGKRKAARISVIINSLFFIAGFTVIFVLLGMFSGAVADFIKSAVVMRISGIVVILMGLYITGILNKIKIFSFLNRDAGFNLKNKPAGIIGSVVIGAIFAGAWTPCIGPILASILFISATFHNSLEGGSLLFIYSMGLAVPFFISAISLNLFFTAFKRFKKYIRTIQIISGVLLIAVGILIFFNYLAIISLYFGNTFQYNLPFNG
ncbi:MAG: cytochrome c biogenesis protein CcdA [Deltaproteobacteria bacterium]|nr:cytochrome c biogenesis protein CcdA [Deltaproteobacteria bacterium]